MHDEALDNERVHCVPAPGQAQSPRLLRLACPALVCEGWRLTIEAGVERCRSDRGDPDFSLHSSSLRLRALSAMGLDPVTVALPLWRGPLRGAIDAFLGRHVALLADQCWARCQYAPGRAPPGHAAHGWHQDGALHFDFGTLRANRVPLRMLTCWIALTPCGGDAPGLELLRTPLAGLLPPPELDAQRVFEQHASAEFWRPLMGPGDLLLFSGDTLHRTHVAPAMTQHRVSLELRFVAAEDRSPQLRGERRVTLGAA
ncbi:MAG: phytanoyl-CoA dioxygenase family protein [Rubrivivax sp.]|nr:phytanoyl-CoA dioxygenase family protein [Rubrivivax sp.]